MFKIGRFFGEQLKVLLRSKDGDPMTWNSYDSSWDYIHGKKSPLPSHDESGSPIAWVIIPTT